MRFELGSERLLPRWVVVFFVGGALVLIPWIVLMFTVPQLVNVSRRWELVWGGFDCFLVLGFAVTAFRLITRSPRGAVTAAMTGTMLLIDAWFDVLTTHRGSQVVSILMAVFAEIPCALICFYVSRRIVALFEQAKDYLAGAGFRVRGGQLVPPEGFPSGESVPPPALGAPRPRVHPAAHAEPALPAALATGVPMGLSTVPGMSGTGGSGTGVSGPRADWATTALEPRIEPDSLRDAAFTAAPPSAGPSSAVASSAAAAGASSAGGLHRHGTGVTTAVFSHVAAAGLALGHTAGVWRLPSSRSRG